MTHDPQKLATGRKWITVSAASFDAIPSLLPFSYETFVLLLAADARGASDQALRKSCSQLLTAGGRYVCCWGADCSRVHHARDFAAVGLGLNRGDAGIMTKWHDRGTLQGGNWFSADAALPPCSYNPA